jgi:uncharacterized protein YjbJ (UPF0337 family)
MGENLTNRIKGKAEQIGGTIQKAVGEAIGSDKMAHKGATHEAHGEAVVAVAKTEAQVKSALAAAADSAKAGAATIASEAQLAKDKLHEAATKVKADLRR